jgi:hypothetical protein
LFRKFPSVIVKDVPSNVLQEIFWFLQQEIKKNVKLLGLASSVEGGLGWIEILRKQPSPLFPIITIWHEHHEPLPPNPVQEFQRLE